jgi:hypothetical protein
MSAPAVSRGARLVQRAVLLAARRPFRGAWRAAYRLAARAAAALLARGLPRPSVYQRGSLASVDFLPGLSDVDVVLVFPSGTDMTAARSVVHGRWDSLRHRSAAAASLLDRPLVLGEDELRAIEGHSAYTAGLREGAPDEPSGDASTAHRVDRRRLLERPGLLSTTTGWILVSGRDTRPREKPRGEQEVRVAVWLELLFYWKRAFEALAGPAHPHTAALCAKLVAEPARALAWLAGRQRLGSRREALEWALDATPERATEIRHVIAVDATLRRLPDPPLDDALRALAALTEKTAAEIERQLRPVRRVAVALVGGGAGEALPLCDWAALVWPHAGELTFALRDGLSRPEVARAALDASRPGCFAAVAGRDVLAFPAPIRHGAAMRSVACRATDPVSFALAHGSAVASFPEVAGWSALDWSRRAVAEHRQALGNRAGERAAGLLAAARAALFRTSLVEGRPQLCLTLDAALNALRDRGALDERAAGGVAETLRLERDGAPAVQQRGLDELREAVAQLPAFAAR